MFTCVKLLDRKLVGNCFPRRADSVAEELGRNSVLCVVARTLTHDHSPALNLGDAPDTAKKEIKKANKAADAALKS